MVVWKEIIECPKSGAMDRRHLGLVELQWTGLREESGCKYEIVEVLRAVFGPVGSVGHCPLGGIVRIEASLCLNNFVAEQNYVLWYVLLSVRFET
jgi:hypothetical protein